MVDKKRENAVVQSSIVGTVLTIRVLGTDEPIVFDASEASAANRAHAEMHGWKQRLSDKAAMSVNKETGRPASPHDKYEAILQLAQYYQGSDVDWRMTGPGTGGQGDGLLLTALMEYKPAAGRDKLKAHLKTLSAKQKAALLVSKELKGIVDRLRAEATASVDTEELFAGLDDIEEIETLTDTDAFIDGE